MLIMHRIFIGFGSNIEPERNIRTGLKLLTRSMRILATSNFYLTCPVNSPGAPDFFNGAVLAMALLDAKSVKKVLSQIEADCGRTRGADKNASRPLDLDILLYDEVTVNEPGLVLPHPDIYERWFVAQTLFELDPKMILPGGASLAEVVSRFGNRKTKPVEPFSSNLRKELIHE